jgi:hypothetical protein
MISPKGRESAPCGLDWLLTSLHFDLYFRGGEGGTLFASSHWLSLKPKTTKAKLISCVFFCLTTRPPDPTSIQVTSLKNDENNDKLKGTVGLA